MLSNNGGAVFETHINGQDAAGEDRHKWFAVYTMSRHEKRIAEQCESIGIGHFLPLYILHRTWKNRVTVDVNLPLFPNYIFARLSHRDHVSMLRLPGVLSIVGNSAGSVPIPASEMDALRRFVSCKTVAPHAYVEAGDAVRINRGPFKGLSGVVLRKNNGLRFVVTLDLIGKSMAVDLSADDLEAFHEERVFVADVKGLSA